MKKHTKRIATECISWRWHGNLGDDMIFAAQEAMFGNMFDLGQYLSAPKAVLVGGGTFVPKCPEHPDLLKLSQQLPTAFFGTGIGDPIFWGVDHIPEWLEVMKNSQFIGVRGPLSKERLEDWGFPGDRIEWIGDVGLCFADEGRNHYRFDGKIGVNLGITYGKLYGFDEQQLEKTVTLALRQLERVGWNITLISAWPPDDEVLNRIKTKLHISEIEYWYDDYARALESVEKFDMILSEKLHVAVVAACRHVPFVALNYRSKVMDFCRSIGWEKFCVSTENLDLDQVMVLIATLTQARNHYSKQLRENVTNTRKRLVKFAPYAVSALIGSFR